MIQDVYIKTINKNEDERGWLSELQRADTDIQSSMCYMSFTKNGVVRIPREHKEQTNFFVFVGTGDFELYLWDNRKGSETYGVEGKLIVGESNPVSVSIPPGVIYGLKSISEDGSFCINLPNRLYKGVLKSFDTDEIRYEKDSKFIIK